LQAVWLLRKRCGRRQLGVVARSSGVGWLPLAFGWWLWFEAGPSVWAQGTQEPVAVVAARAIQRTVRSEGQYVGTVVPLRSVQVGSAAAGRVMKLDVEEGQRVSRGEVLAELESTLIEAQLAQARAELELRRQELAELKNGSRPQEIEAAEARYRAARVLLDRQQRHLTRVSNLYERGGARDEELDAARTAVEEAVQRLREAEATLKLVQEGPRVERIAQAEAAVAAQEARVQELSIRLEKHRIQAPFTGYIVRKLTDLGAWLREGDPLVEMVGLDEVDVDVHVPEEEVAQLALGTPATVTLPAVKDRIFQASVVRIVPQAVLTARAFPVRVRLKNEFGPGQVPLFKAGYFARVLLPTGPAHLATLVPKDALVLGGSSPVIYVVEGSPGPEKPVPVRAVAVKFGLAWQEWIEVSGGIQPGQLVIVRGNERLHPQQLVRVAEVLPAPEEATPRPPTRTVGGAAMRSSALSR
jgi:RND family efflux transporter MFP subunit